MKEKTSSAFITVLWNNYIFLDFFTKLVTIILFTYYFYFLFSNRYLVLVSKEVDGSRFARLSAEKNKNHRKVLCVYQPTEIRVKFRQYEYAAFQYNISCQVKSTANWFSKHLHVCKKNHTHKTKIQNTELHVWKKGIGVIMKFYPYRRCLGMPGEIWRRAYCTQWD